MEEEKRLHRCCFTGHRPEKLGVPEETVRHWLEEKIDEAIRDGFTTFISGCAQGVDLWAGEIVLRKKAENPELRLIAAVPWPGFGKSWGEPWGDMYDMLLRQADLVVNVCDHYHQGVFQQRNVWMVDRSYRLIAVYNGNAGGTRNTIEYAKKKLIKVVWEPLKLWDMDSLSSKQFFNLMADHILDNCRTMDDYVRANDEIQRYKKSHHVDEEDVMYFRKSGASEKLYMFLQE